MTKEQKDNQKPEHPYLFYAQNWQTITSTWCCLSNQVTWQSQMLRDRHLLLSTIKPQLRCGYKNMWTIEINDTIYQKISKKGNKNFILWVCRCIFHICSFSSITSDSFQISLNLSMKSGSFFYFLSYFGCKGFLLTFFCSYINVRGLGGARWG